MSSNLLSMPLNTLPIEEAFQLIGDDGKQRIARLSNWLGLPLPQHVRYAPSIVVRSEAEIFGISSPRFALRFYLAGDLGFVNCRRLAVLAETADVETWRVWGRRIPGSRHPLKRNVNITDELPPPDLGDVLKEAHQSCIADCLFVPPAWLKRDYDVLITKLGRAYGEEALFSRTIGSPNDPTTPAHDFEIGGTPYVQNIDLGGGLCAQAVCFMATALHQGTDDVLGVFGLAEITAYAHSDDSGELRISGLSIDEIIQYFGKIRLGAIQQMPNPHLLSVRKQQEFEVALSAYLRSKMPVILPVDMGRMACQGVYDRNGITVTLDSSNAYRHTIILVGCSNRFQDGQLQLVFNDPSWLPFMVETSDTLAQCGMYADGGVVEDRLCIPVTPMQVRMPLLSWRNAEQQPSVQGGLLFISDTIHNGPWDGRFPRVPSWAEPTRFMLIQAKALFFPQTLLMFDDRTRLYFGGGMTPHQGALLRRLARGENHWIWLESAGDALWIWDAEAAPDPGLARPTLPYSLGKLLISIFVSAGDGRVSEWPRS